MARLYKAMARLYKAMARLYKAMARLYINMPIKKIYFDYAATTPMDPRVIKAMQPFWQEKFGNPHSIHQFGQEASAAVEGARETLAKFLHCSSEEIIFTSGATEADNLAIQGVVKRKAKSEKRKISDFHLITTKIEHPAVLEVFQILEKEGAEVTYLSVDKKGVVKIEELKRAIKENTILVSIMYVNNETGSVQDIAKIGQIISDENNRRKQPIYFHTDAVQAVNYFDCDVKKLGVDLMSISGHKIYGPKGIGALYIKKGTPFKPLYQGGHQEKGLRPGTLAVPLIVGLGKAVELLKIRNPKSEIRNLRNYLVQEILKKIPDSYLNGDIKKGSPGIANFIFKKAEGESILLKLDLEGIAVSTGSACASGSLKPSHVLLAMGVSQEEAHGSLRISLGRFTTRSEVQKLVAVLPGVVGELRRIAP